MPAPPRAPQPVQWTSQLPNTPQSVCGCTSLANIRAVPHTQHREPFVEGSPPTALGRTVERLVPRLGRSANPSSACVLLVCTESSAAAHLQTRSTSSSSSFPQSSSCYSPPSASIQSVRSLTAYSSHCQCALLSLLAVSAFAALPLRSSELAYLWLAGWLALVSSHIPTSSASKPPPSPLLLQIRSLTLRSLPHRPRRSVPDLAPLPCSRADVLPFSPHRAEANQTSHRYFCRRSATT